MIAIATWQTNGECAYTLGGDHTQNQGYYIREWFNDRDHYKDRGCNIFMCNRDNKSLLYNHV